MKDKLTVKQQKISAMIESLVVNVNSFIDEKGHNRFLDLVRTIDTNMSFKRKV